MKVGIMTQPLGKNYGGVLQNWALQKILKQLGHEPVTINLQRRHHEIKKQIQKVSLLKKSLVRCRNLMIKMLLYKPVLQKNESYKRADLNLADFVKQNIHITKSLDPPLESQSLVGYQFDAILVGSDQVWRPSYSPHIENFFLDFLSNDKETLKLAYAASFGSSVAEYSSELNQKCSELLKQFKFISVREHSAMEICKNHFGVEAQCVLDPTLLLNAEDYASLANDELSSGLGNNYGVCYFLDPNETKIAHFVRECELRKITPISLIPIDNTYHSDLLVPSKYPSLQRWLKGIMQSGFVMTDSFHGMVFSLIFDKTFMAFNNSARGSDRFSSILKIFGIVSDEHLDVISNKHISKDFHRLLSEWKSSSRSFLNDALCH